MDTNGSNLEDFEKAKEAMFQAMHMVPSGAVIPAGTSVLVKVSMGGFIFHPHGYHEDYIEKEDSRFSHYTLEDLSVQEDWMHAKAVMADVVDMKGKFSREVFVQDGTTWYSPVTGISYPSAQMKGNNPVILVESNRDDDCVC